jgi:hypothetical protein
MSRLFESVNDEGELLETVLPPTLRLAQELKAQINIAIQDYIESINQHYTPKE